MHYERQIVAVRQRNLGGKSLALHRAGGIVVVVVEPALPYRHQLGLALQERLHCRHAVDRPREGGGRRWPTRRRSGLGNSQRLSRMLRVGPDRDQRVTPAALACSIASTPIPS